MSAASINCFIKVIHQISLINENFKFLTNSLAVKGNGQIGKVGAVGEVAHFLPITALRLELGDGRDTDHAWEILDHIAQELPAKLYLLAVERPGQSRWEMN